MNIKKYIYLIVTLATLGSLALVIPASAQTQPGAQNGGRFGRGMMPGVFGTVSAINGDSLTVTGMKGRGGNTSGTTYTVDATNATVTKNGASSSVSAIAVGDTIMVQGTVSGTSVTAKTIRDGVVTGGGLRGGMGVGGTVASINGTTLTVTGRVGPNGGTAPTYTVDATNATVTKNGASSSVSAIAVGDTIMVQGTVSGTSVTAKTIRDGVVQPVIQGNGQPVVAGKVTAVSGSSITITNNSNVTYTVDASNAKFVVRGITNPTISNIATGDNLVVQGTVNGANVAASSVIDQKTKTNGSSNTNPKPQGGFMGGLMGGIGNFFRKLFGF